MTKEPPSVVHEAPRATSPRLVWLRERAREAFAIDPRSMALFRAGLAVAVLCDTLAAKLPAAAVFYSDGGLWPRYAIRKSARNLWHLLPSFWGGSATAIQLHFLAATLTALALLVGYRTRIATILTWLLVCSHDMRNLMVLNGGNTLMKILLFWAIFLDLGRCWSLDARRRRAAGAKPEAPGMLFSPWGAATLLQVTVIYWSTAILKWGDAWHTEGSALYFALAHEKIATGFGHFLTAYPSLLRLLTFGSLALELCGPFLALAPFLRGRLRAIAAASFIGFHVGIFLCMNVGIFPLISIVAWTLFIPAFVWDHALARLRKTAAVATPTAPVTVIVPEISKRWRVLHAIPLVLIATVYYWNATTLPGLSVEHSPLLTTAMYVVRLRQHWAMFRKPLPNNNRVVATATSKGGTVYDVLGDRPIDWEHSSDVYNTTQGLLWRKYLPYVRKIPKARRPLAAYLCHSWNTSHPDHPAEEVELFNVKQRVANPYRGETRIGATTHSMMWRHSCAPATLVEPPQDDVEDDDDDDDGDDN